MYVFIYLYAPRHVTERRARALPWQVDLPSQKITRSDGSTISFEVDAFKKHCLINGLDDIGRAPSPSSPIALCRFSSDRDRIRLTSTPFWVIEGGIGRSLLSPSASCGRFRVARSGKEGLVFRV